MFALKLKQRYVWTGNELVIEDEKTQQQTFFESWQYGLNEDARNDSVLAA